MNQLHALLTEREHLDAEIQTLRQQERAAAIEEARELVKAFDLQAEELFNKPVKLQQETIKRLKPAARYKCPETGATWSGRGLKPRWLTLALSGGKTLQNFAIEAH